MTWVQILAVPFPLGKLFNRSVSQIPDNIYLTWDAERVKTDK